MFRYRSLLSTGVRRSSLYEGRLKLELRKIEKAYIIYGIFNDSFKMIFELFLILNFTESTLLITSGKSQLPLNMFPFTIPQLRLIISVTL